MIVAFNYKFAKSNLLPNSSKINFNHANVFCSLFALNHRLLCNHVHCIILRAPGERHARTVIDSIFSQLTLLTPDFLPQFHAPSLITNWLIIVKRTNDSVGSCIFLRVSDELALSAAGAGWWIGLGALWKRLNSQNYEILLWRFHYKNYLMYRVSSLKLTLKVKPTNKLNYDPLFRNSHFDVCYPYIFMSSMHTHIIHYTRLKKKTFDTFDH